MNAGALSGQSMLLVDDVITTGATVEACARALHSKGECELHIASVAFSN